MYKEICKNSPCGENVSLLRQRPKKKFKNNATTIISEDSHSS